MSLFLNHYKCPRCNTEWDDEWDCMCDDDCPSCGMRHISPHNSEDLGADTQDQTQDIAD